MITLLTNTPPCAKKLLNPSSIAFKSSFEGDVYKRVKKNILSTVPQREYNDRKQYILDCMDGKKELDTENFLKDPNDRKKNLIILTEITKAYLKDYKAAIKRSDKAALSDDNHPLNKNVLKTVDFWKNKITQDDKNKYINPNFEDEDDCIKQYGLTETEWVCSTIHMLVRDTGEMEVLHRLRHNLERLQYLK